MIYWFSQMHYGRLDKNKENNWKMLNKIINCEEADLIAIEPLLNIHVPWRFPFHVDGCLSILRILNVHQ